MISPYLNSKEAMAYLRLTSSSSLYYLINERRLPYLRRGGRLLFDTREIDAWLGSAARYAVIEPQTLEFYRGRAPYREHVERIETLLRTNFGLLATVSAPPASVFLVYRRTS